MSGELALLPTSGIADPQTRAFMDRLLQVWNSNSKGDNGYVRRSEFAGLTADVLNGSASLPGSAASSVDALSQSIRNSLLFQKLGSAISLDDLDALRNEVASGMRSENTQRINDDSVLASAINRIWGYIGGSSAVITEGSLATANPSAAVASKWNSVIAAVTDPNTGNVNSAAILQETRAYANSANGTFNALYSVRAQVSADGQTVVGGFGLSATGGAGSAQGPTISFGVLADSFYIAQPNRPYDVASEYQNNFTFPFVVVTTPAVINGVVYQPGVYIKKAIIGDASIDNAKIKNAAVDTLTIAGNAVTVPAFLSAGVSDLSMTYTLNGEPGVPYSVFILVSLTQSFSSTIEFDVNGSMVWTEAPLGGTILCKGWVVSLAPGTHTIRIFSTDSRNTNGTAIFALATKR